MNKITPDDHAVYQLISYAMTSHECILIPKKNYTEQQPKKSEILEDSTIDELAKFLTLMPRQQYSNKNAKDDKVVPDSAKSDSDNRDIIGKTGVLKSLSKMKPWQTEKSKPIRKKFFDSPDISINEDGFLTIDDKPTSLEATNFLYILQQPKTSLHGPNFQKILSKIDVLPQLIPYSDVKMFSFGREGEPKETLGPSRQSRWAILELCNGEDPPPMEVFRVSLKQVDYPNRKSKVSFKLKTLTQSIDSIDSIDNDFPGLKL